MPPTKRVTTKPIRRRAFATEQDPELAEWIGREVCFPNAMVDRITPVTAPADIKYLEKEYGLKDEWPVTCEPFVQWVIEDNSCGPQMK